MGGRLAADLPQGALQQQIAALGRPVEERLRRHLAQCRFHLAQRGHLLTALHAAAHMPLDPADVLLVQDTENVRAEEFLLLVPLPVHATTSRSPAGCWGGLPIRLPSLALFCRNTSRNALSA